MPTSSAPTPEARRAPRTPSSLLQSWRVAIDLDNADNARALLNDPRSMTGGWGPQALGGSDGTYLNRAAGLGSVNVVNVLLPLSDPNHPDQDGHTALMLAAMNGHPKVIAALRQDPRVSVLKTDPDGMTALHLAASSGQALAIEALLDGIPASTPNPQRNTLALHDAADDGTVAALDLLLPFGGTNHQDAAGWTPIMYAAINGRTAAVERLAPLSDLSLRNEDQDTVLVLARRRGIEASVRLIEVEAQRQEAATLRGAMGDALEASPTTPARARL